MKKIILFVCLLLSALPQTYSQTYSTAKPWAFWWWFGSAVDKEGIKKNLEIYQKAGFGGLHIIPIYGVKGEEEKFLDYLSPQWLEMLDFTVNEAQKLGLGIDMTMGTGWPFGGAKVNLGDAAKSLEIKSLGDSLMASAVLTKQQVKRAAPGAEGLVIDHFSSMAFTNYAQAFVKVFDKKNYGIRAFYNDSYEVYGANWTDTFLDDFKRLRGYDLAKYLKVLTKNTAETDDEKRIWADYHETISDLLRDNFTNSFNQFAHRYGKITRNQSHGSPANMLDLYALNDIPETEFFGSKAYNIPLYRQDEDYQESQFGKPNLLVLKLASSAANVSGKNLVSSETATWLANHFKVSLSQIKPIIDESFVGGVNHIFYHGIPYSPPNESFPGWLFYASTNFNQNSHFWEELPELNRYVENCQKQLQNTKPDNELLVYLPIYDLWHSAGKNAKVHLIDVHNLLKGNLFSKEVKEMLQTLINQGYSFDFVSDLQLKNTFYSTAIHQYITQGKSHYKTIIIPPSDFMPMKTLEKLQEFSEKGGSMIFVGKMPSKVAGFKDWEIKQKRFDFLKTLLQARYFSSDFIEKLKQKSILGEKLLAENGLSFIRKNTYQGGKLYFISNLENKNQNPSITLNTNAQSVLVFDPLHQTRQWISFKRIAPNKIEIPVSLASGESIIIETYLQKMAQATETIAQKMTKPQEIRGKWSIDFVKGIPALPQSIMTDSLKSWTIATDTLAQYFSGVAKYSIDFEVDSTYYNHTTSLDLGDVRESARVWLNGKDLGKVWCLPFTLKIQKGDLKPKNHLEIEVRNLSANYVRLLDKQKVAWRKFYDINFVDITYKPFDASQWKPVPSGLLGRVKITVIE